MMNLKWELKDCRKVLVQDSFDFRMNLKWELKVSISLSISITVFFKDESQMRIESLYSFWRVKRTSHYHSLRWISNENWKFVQLIYKLTQPLSADFFDESQMRIERYPTQKVAQSLLGAMNLKWELKVCEHTVVHWVV